ncbi:MAG: hypothetical protein Ct9H300mP12_01660 [Acidimicrobiales bacterium]|nr:MAG: hypothetical protein Ct9H300mP12_01660 [Acidimicrobiales bacterium]
MNARRRGGLGPSNAAAAPRAFLLIAVAVVIGLVLLWKGLDSTPGTVAPADAPVVAEKSTDESPVDQGSGTSAERLGCRWRPLCLTTRAHPRGPAPTTTEDPFPEPT